VADSSRGRAAPPQVAQHFRRHGLGLGPIDRSLWVTYTYFFEIQGEFLACLASSESW